MKSADASKMPVSNFKNKLELQRQMNYNDFIDNIDSLYEISSTLMKFSS